MTLVQKECTGRIQISPHVRGRCRDPGQEPHWPWGIQVGDHLGMLLLPGGGDIEGDIPQRECSLIRSFVANGRPVLGICRGMQALNVYFGGTLHRYIDGHQLPQGDIVHPTHALGIIRELLGKTPTVNSNHHQAVAKLGHGLRVVQRSQDDVVEALCHHTLPIWGVQWHPERQSFALQRADAVDAAPLFRYFLSQIS